MIRYSQISAILTAIHTELANANITAKSNFDNRIKDSKITIQFDPVERNDKDLVNVRASVYFDKIQQTETFDTLVANVEVAFNKHGLIPDLYTFESGNLTIDFIPRFDLTL
jgi:hypothetical protein